MSTITPDMDLNISTPSLSTPEDLSSPASNTQLEHAGLTQAEAKSLQMSFDEAYAAEGLSHTGLKRFFAKADFAVMRTIRNISQKEGGLWGIPAAIARKLDFANENGFSGIRLESGKDYRNALLDGSKVAWMTASGAILGPLGIQAAYGMYKSASLFVSLIKNPKAFAQRYIKTVTTGSGLLGFGAAAAAWAVGGGTAAMFSNITADALLRNKQRNLANSNISDRALGNLKNLQTFSDSVGLFSTTKALINSHQVISNFASWAVSTIPTPTAHADEVAYKEVSNSMAGQDIARMQGFVFGADMQAVLGNIYGPHQNTNPNLIDHTPAHNVLLENNATTQVERHDSYTVVHYSGDANNSPVEVITEKDQIVTVNGVEYKVVGIQPAPTTNIDAINLAVANEAEAKGWPVDHVLITVEPDGNGKLQTTTILLDDLHGNNELKVETPAVSEAPKQYEVQAGDTLSKIANRYDVTVSELVELNNIPNPDLIEIGQDLVLPEHATFEGTERSGSNIKLPEIFNVLPEEARRDIRLERGMLTYTADPEVLAGNHYDAYQPSVATIDIPDEISPYVLSGNPQEQTVILQQGYNCFTHALTTAISDLKGQNIDPVLLGETLYFAMDQNSKMVLDENSGLKSIDVRPNQYDSIGDAIASVTSVDREKFLAYALGLELNHHNLFSELNVPQSSMENNHLNEDYARNNSTQLGPQVAAYYQDLLSQGARPILYLDVFMSKEASPRDPNIPSYINLPDSEKTVRSGGHALNVIGIRDNNLIVKDTNYTSDSKYMNGLEIIPRGQGLLEIPLDNANNLSAIGSTITTLKVIDNS